SNFKIKSVSLKTLVAYCLLFIIWCSGTSVFAQSTDNQYIKPLKEVLTEVENRFGVKIKYNEEQVKDKWLNYADWRFRADVDQTLRNILAPLDMKVNKEKDKVYKLKE